MKRLMMFLVLILFPLTSYAADLEKGKTLFEQRCASCHGNEGKGDGPAAQGFPANMKPRNLAEGKFKAATDDAKFKELLTKGGASLGLSPLMPPQAGLSDDDLNNIIAFVHSLKK